MERETLIGVAFVLVGLYLVTFKKWLSKNQAKWASARGGIVERNVNSLSTTAHERNALIIGSVLVIAGLAVVTRDLTDLQPLSRETFAALFMCFAAVSFGHAIFKTKTKWAITIATFLLITASIFLASELL